MANYLYSSGYSMMKAMLQDSEIVSSAANCSSSSHYWTMEPRYTRAGPMGSTWSFLPIDYLPYTSHLQQCIYLENTRKGDISCGKAKPKSKMHQNQTEEDTHKSSSISMNLKFGIERILTEGKENEKSSGDISISQMEHKLSNEKTNTEKRRRKNGTRSVFSHVQRNILELHYQQREYVTKGERYHIAMETGISEEQVKIWFQNRRTKKKKIEGKKPQLETKTITSNQYNSADSFQVNEYNDFV